MNMDDNETKVIGFIRERTDVVASLPALLLCAVTFVMLVLDMLLPAMSSLQYVVYPLLVKMAGLVGIVCAAACFVSDQYDRRFVPGAETAFFAVFSLLMILSTGVNGLSKEAVFGVPYRYVGVFDIILFMVVYMYCPTHIRSEKWKERILLIYMLVADCIALAFIVDELFGIVVAFHDKREPGAIFFHGNHYGYYLAIAILISAGFFMMKKGMLMTAGLVSFALNLAALAFNRTMGAFLAAGAALMLFAVYSIVNKRSVKWKPWSIILIPSVIIATALIMSPVLRKDAAEILFEFRELASGVNDIYAGNGRWGIWQFVLDLIALKPLLGYGCEGIRTPLRLYALTESPHNEVLTYAVYFGIPAAIAYTGGVITSIIKVVRRRSANDACIIAAFAAAAYFISSLVGVAFFYTVPFFFMMLGMGLADGSTDCDKS